MSIQAAEARSAVCRVTQAQGETCAATPPWVKTEAKRVDTRTGVAAPQHEGE